MTVAILHGSTDMVALGAILGMELLLVIRVHKIIGKILA